MSDIDYINEHRQALGLHQFERLDRREVAVHLKLIARYAPNGHNPWLGEHLPPDHPVRVVAQDIAYALMCDVDVPTWESLPHLVRACFEEHSSGSTLPDDVEVDALVMGGGDGEIPEELQRRFPRINAALNAFF